MLTDPSNLAGGLWIAEKGRAQFVPDRITKGKRWLQALTKQGGVINGWLGFVGNNNAVQWTANLFPNPMPAQFTEDALRDVLESGEVFTFADHVELVSGGLIPLIKGGEVIGVLGITSDQTDYFKPDNLKWMTALCGVISSDLFAGTAYDQEKDVEYSISRILQSTLDVLEGLHVVLRTLAEALNADVVVALRYNPLPGRYELLATHGLGATALAKLNFHLDVGRSGRPSDDPVWVGDLSDRPRSQQTISPLKEEGYRGYLALPLVAKGHLVGALEIAWRAPQVSPIWDAGFLERISEQVAFAIDRTNVLNSYRELNTELTLRYNAMIEGLSRALELRDLETDGHTRRVGELTMRMIEHMGGPADQWDAIRQGALLHDIGKIGIPDAILLKPGSLTDRERQVMQQHVIYGYNILAPITNLRPILDIVLYHHERWDGSGYPYGLKGEQIPLVARTFAFVDVFDALTSDRPYRLAWSRKQAMEYVREQAGRGFDPHLTVLFLEVVGKEG
jgi:HD-GYP domain-containing protein (c-di-GMP phosphodiesterase class II)